ncbi:MAG TPA: hypothetical protein VK638_35310 [Edaphobacter sp.]|nr:hypothetical protein [Edaphobacter sp.]
MLGRYNFGAQPGDRNPFGYKDSISNPAIKGSGVECFPGQGDAIEPDEFILGYPRESEEIDAIPQPLVLGKNGKYVVLRKYRSQVGAFNRFLRDEADTDEARELLAAKLSAVGEAVLH